MATISGTNGETGVRADLLTADEVAAMLRVRKSWVYAATRTNAIPHVRLGRYVRFRGEAIEAWLGGLENDGPTGLGHGPLASDPGGAGRR